MYALTSNLFKTICIDNLVRNLDLDEGLCNGTHLFVRALLNRLIGAEIATGAHKGKRVFIPRILLTLSESELPFI